MGRALIVSAGASSNEYLCARLTELVYPAPHRAQRGGSSTADAGIGL